MNRLSAVTRSVVRAGAIFALSGGLWMGCSSAEERATKHARTATVDRLERAIEYTDSLYAIDSARNAQLRAAENRYPVVNYSRVYVRSRSTLDSIRDAFDYGQLSSPRYKAFVTLNRRVFGSVRVGDTVVVPDTVPEEVLALSVFPHLWLEARDIPKIIVISNKQQAYACYENGKQVRFAACNTGTESKPTLPGRYAINWKERLRISSLNENWKLPFNLNFHLFAGNAFHQYYMPGRPVSHSCVRQFMDDAKWLYNWAQVGVRNARGRVKRFTGTPVLIVDMFDYTRPRFGPWLDLSDNRSNKIRLPNAPMEVEEAYIPISQIPPSVRGSLPNRARYVYAEDTLRNRGVLREGARLAHSIEYTKRKREREKREEERRKREEAAQEIDRPTPETIEVRNIESTTTPENDGSSSPTTTNTAPMPESPPASDQPKSPPASTRDE